MAQDNPTIDLNHQYQLYLEKVQLKEEEMFPIQRRQTKQAFLGACGQMLDLLCELGKLEENQGISAVHQMHDQVDNFFHPKVE